jgi:hypothetical protein
MSKLSGENLLQLFYQGDRIGQIIAFLTVYDGQFFYLLQ